MKKCAVINDLSGFGKCSLCAGISVLSVLGAEAHPLPTAVLSAQTGYSSYLKIDLTEYMPSIFEEWKKMGVSFDGILTGYFSDEKQVDVVMDFAKASDALLLVDPVMGDSGEMYKGFSDSLCSKIKSLALMADIVTPNVTELYLLTGEQNIEKAAGILLESGIKTVIVTGIKKDNLIGNAVFEKGCRKEYFSACHKGSFSGTGDILSAAVMGKILAGSDAFSAVEAAAEFIALAIRDTDTENRNDGIAFEKFLYRLGRNPDET